MVQKKGQFVSQNSIIHLPSEERREDDWSPFVVGDLVAGEYIALPVTREGEEPRRLGKASMWRHAGGVLPYERPASDEFMYVISGKVRISAGDHAVEASAGDVLIVPQGFVGTWETIDPVVKVSATLLD